MRCTRGPAFFPTDFGTSAPASRRNDRFIERAVMQSTATPSVEISIAMLSWINYQLRETIAVEEDRQLSRTAEWIQHAVTAISVALMGTCILMLQRWA
jgi:hypothetical protein